MDYTPVNTAREWAERHTDDILAHLANTTQRGVGQAIGRWVNNASRLNR